MHSFDHTTTSSLKSDVIFEFSALILQHATKLALQALYMLQTGTHTDIQQGTQGTLYLSNAMRCIGQTINAAVSSQ